METFKDRLLKEANELEERLNKLNDFNQSDKFYQIDKVQQRLLLIQAGAMYTYLEILKARLGSLD